MFYIKFIKYLYLGLTIFALITPVKISFVEFIPGLILMWFLYILYFAGISEKKIDYSSFHMMLSKPKDNRLGLIVAVTYIIFYPFYIKLYTGLNILTTLSNAMSGISNYALYQNYFVESKLNSFSFTKLPYIVIHGILKFLFIKIVFKTIIYKDRTSILDIISISTMVITIAIVGLARGTSYEFFELFLIFFFAILTKRTLAKQKRMISKGMLIKILVITSVILIFFSYNIQKRFGESINFLSQSRFDKHSLLYLIAPPVALAFYLLSDYFLFGLQFNSIAINHLWFSSFDGFCSSFIPHGIVFLGIDKGYKEFVEQFVFVGAKWIPDSIILIQSYGLILTFIIIYFLGRFSRKIYSEIGKNIYATILLFYSCYIMFSLPIGNFITASSANIITIFCALIFFKLEFFKKILENICIMTNK